MKIRQYLYGASLAIAALTLHGCGSSNSSATPSPPATTAPTAVPLATAAPFTASSVVTAPAAAAAVALPANAVYTGSIGLGAPTVPIPPGTTISDTLTNVAPSTANAPRLSDLLRRTLGSRQTASANGAIVVLAYIDFLYSNSVTYSSVPSFSLTVPANEITNASYYVAAYDPTRPSLGWQLGFEGPAKVSGTTLSFSGAAKSFTFAANANYYFATYAISAAAAVPTAAPSVAPVVPTAAPAASPSATPTPTPTPTATSTSIPTPAPSPTATLAPGIVALASGATINFVLPSGYTAAMTLPTATSSTTARVVAATTPPTGTGPAPGTALFYLSVTPAAQITFTSGTVSGTFNSPTALSGSYKLDLLAPGLGWLAGNPATATGSSVNFSFALSQAITLNAGATYLFAISH